MSQPVIQRRNSPISDILAGFLQRFVPGLFTCIGSVAIFFQVSILRDAAESAKWPIVQGSIVESTVYKHDYKNYSPHIRYRFRYNGHNYIGKQIICGMGTSGLSDAENAVSTYPVGKTVSVSVCPGDPTESVLEPGLTSKHVWTFIFWSSWTGISLVFAINPQPRWLVSLKKLYANPVIQQKP
jgi:hypothetical protein